MQVEQFLGFAECFSEAILMLSRQGDLLAVNQAGLVLLETTDAGVFGTALRDYVNDDPACLETFLHACAVSTTPVIGALRFKSRNGTLRTLCQGRAVPAGLAGTDSPLLIRCFPDGDPAGDDRALTALLAQLGKEIERRQRVEQALRSSMAHAKSVLDTAADAIVTIDSRGIIRSLNPAAERLFGYRASELIGENIRRLMPLRHGESHDAYILRYLNTAEKHIIGVGREVQARRKDGSVFPIELAVSEVRLDDQLHFTGIIRDITERKLAEKRLRRQQEEARQHRERLVHVGRLSTMGELAAGIAHEINQPLTAISAYAQAGQRLLDPSRPAVEELLRILDKIGVQAQRAGQVIQRLRGMIRRRESHRELCDLNRLIQETRVLTEADARLHNLDIRMSLSPRPLPVVVDPIQIQQVVINLIRNGLDAMVEAKIEGGVIAIDTRLIDEETAGVSVSDQGPGIPEPLRANLFNPFFTTKEQGIGLGLSISRSIITSHGGKLGFTPAPEGGAMLHFTLPLALEWDDD